MIKCIVATEMGTHIPDTWKIIHTEEFPSHDNERWCLRLWVTMPEDEL